MHGLQEQTPFVLAFGFKAHIRIAGSAVGEVSSCTARQLISVRTDEDQENLIDAELVIVADRKEGMERLDRGSIDGFASDQIVLIGQVIEALHPKQYSLVTETFSFEPYALVVRRNDAEFRLVANRSLVQVFRSGQHIQIYNKWIGRIGIRPPPILIAMYQLNTLPE